MTRDNNIYGKLVNNKFSDLLTSDMNITWLQMHAVLDREMPQDKEKRRGLLVRWRSTGTIIAIAMIAAAVSYYSYKKNNEETANNKPSEHKTLKETKQVSAPARPLDKKSVLSGESVEQEFLPKNIAANHDVITASVIISNNYSVSRNNLIQQKFSNQNTSFVDNNAITEKHTNNYTIEGFNSQGMVYGKKYFLSATPFIERVPMHKLLSKGDLIIPGHLSFDPLENKKPALFQKKTGWVLGAAIHYNAPMSNQEMSTMNINGKKNTLTDFIPSVFAQYHLNNKWYVETGFQFSSPQYTPDLKLFSSCVDVAYGKRKERAVWLNKLYYMNIPLSVHFKPFNGISIGTGIQYSHLKRSLLMDEHAGWKEADNGEWNKTYSTTTVNSTSNKSVGNTSADYPSGTTSGWGTPSATATPATDGIEVTSSYFRSTDWRYMLDLNYTWKKYSIGTRYTAGINNYINTQAYGNMLEVKDRNKAIQVYIRMSFLDLRKKSSFH